MLEFSYQKAQCKLRHQHASTVTVIERLANNFPLRNVKVLVDIPEASIIEHTVGTFQTYLDTIGRTAITVKAINVVDEFRDRDLIISYDVSSVTTLRKPFIVFASMMTVYVAAWAVGKVEVGFGQK